MEENGQLVQFLYSGKEVVAETESDGNIIRYIRGLGLVCSDSESAKTYYHYACDELGSITDIVKGAVRKKLEEEKHSEEKAATETAQVLNHYEYDAFGNAVVCEETVSNRFQFAGEQYDTVTGQYYLRARFYNPVIGRFLQEDDYYGDGLNLYAYCKNNPVMYVDPSGHNKESAANKQNTYDDAQEQFYEDIYDAQRESNPEYGDYLNELADTSDGLESTIPEGYYQDANGRWHRPNGQFASHAEVGLPTSNRSSNSTRGGRLGNESTRAQNSDIANYLESQGYTIINGGGRGPEEYLPGPNGTGGSYYVDITAQMGDTIIRINTVDVMADGITPTPKEISAANSINNKIEGNIILIPKGSGLGNLPNIIN